VVSCGKNLEDAVVIVVVAGQTEHLGKVLTLLTQRLTNRQHTSSHALCIDTYNTHPFNGPLSRTTRVGWYQKGKTNLDFTEGRDLEWQWHQLNCMQICTFLQTDSHASTSPLIFYRLDALPTAQPTASKR